jgi:hypothetical protein
MSASLKWDQLQEGDVIVLPFSHGKVPMKLLPTCHVCTSPEMWNCVCVCGSPTCSQMPNSIDVRMALSREGVTVIRDGVTVREDI